MYILSILFLACFSLSGAVAPGLLESSDLRKARFQALYTEDEAGDPAARKPRLVRLSLRMLHYRISTY